MLKLYYSPGACSLAPHILLEELGLPYRLELTPVAEGATRTAEYLAINPKGRVPVLMTEQGEVLTEVPAIALYLARQANHPVLFPYDPLAAARCLEWCNWLSGTLHAIAFGELWRPARFTDDAALHAAIQAKGKDNVFEGYTYIEQRMAERDWAVGHAYTLVDPFLLVFYRWGNRIGVDMRAGYPGFTRHAERMLQRSAVQRALQQESINIWEKAA